MLDCPSHRKIHLMPLSQKPAPPLYNPPSVFGYKIEELLGTVTRNASLGSATFVGMVNERFWQGLPEDIRQLILEVSDEVNEKMAAGFQADTDASYEQLESLGI